MAHYYKDENGVKHRVAGMGLIDRVLSLTSRHAIANDVVTAELNEIRSDIIELSQEAKNMGILDFANKVKITTTAYTTNKKGAVIGTGRSSSTSTPSHLQINDTTVGSFPVSDARTPTTVEFYGIPSGTKLAVTTALTIYDSVYFVPYLVQ